MYTHTVVTGHGRGRLSARPTPRPDTVLPLLRPPPPVFSIVSSLLTHTVALLSALSRFAYTLFASRSAGWDAEKILPPLITLLMAYLALVSFYRTTGWMIRTTFWAVKWGGIIAALAAGAGFLLGNGAQGNGDGVAAFGPGGVLGMLGSMLLGVLSEDNTNGSGRNSGRTRGTKGPRPRSGASGPRTQKSKGKGREKEKEKERPKAWENWDKHRQYSADAAARDDAGDGVQQAAQKVAGYVQEVLGTGWWQTVKNAVEGSGLVGTSGTDEDSSSKRKTRQDAKGRGSPR
ncbi:hypothetical protein C8Q80DRAFT_1220370 [Daedaleopsis nitida]|nr:hypothetical protein C8Q80DRAFT_1220370 [Daedaleopsis nitida]